MSWKAFWRGFGSILDLGGMGWKSETSQRYSTPGSSADDAAALRNDWEIVMNDLGIATEVEATRERPHRSL